MKERLTLEIKEYCKKLKLRGIGEHFEELEGEVSDYRSYLHGLLEFELNEADKRGKACRIRNARFPYRKYLEDLELHHLPVDIQRRLPELSGLGFIEKGQSVIMTGNPGTGKTHVAISLGLKACDYGYKVLFTSAPLLVTELKECVSTKTLRYFQNRFEKYDLVIVDELGYISFDREGAELLFSNLSLRAGRKSTIVTSNLTFERWIEIFGDPTVTSAMVDRLTYKSMLIDMVGSSYRLRETLKINGKSFQEIKDALG